MYKLINDEVKNRFSNNGWELVGQYINNYFI